MTHLASSCEPLHCGRYDALTHSYNRPSMCPIPGHSLPVPGSAVTGHRRSRPSQYVTYPGLSSAHLHQILFSCGRLCNRGLQHAPVLSRQGQATQRATARPPAPAVRSAWTLGSHFPRRQPGAPLHQQPIPCVTRRDHRSLFRIDGAQCGASRREPELFMLHAAAFNAACACLTARLWLDGIADHQRCCLLFAGANGVTVITYICLHKLLTSHSYQPTTTMSAAVPLIFVLVHFHGLVPILMRFSAVSNAHHASFLAIAWRVPLPCPHNRARQAGGVLVPCGALLLARRPPSHLKCIGAARSSNFASRTTASLSFGRR